MDSEAEDVAARLRDKIRNQAAELLLKVDAVKSGTATPASRRSLVAASPKNTKSPSAHSPSERSEPDDQGGQEADVTNPEKALELTKRLQRLALERQKETQEDRLKVIQADQSSHLSSVKTFQELNLPDYLLNAIFAMGFDRPSAIQEAALPRILANPPRDLIGQAQSGSGKTAAFTLGMLFRIELDEPATTQALCVTPTRELAIQIVEKAVGPVSLEIVIRTFVSVLYARGCTVSYFFALL